MTNSGSSLRCDPRNHMNVLRKNGECHKSQVSNEALFRGPNSLVFFLWCFQIWFILLPLLGEVSQFDDTIFFKWVGSTTNWVFPKIGIPQNGWFIMEIPIKNGWFGGTPIFGNPQLAMFFVSEECRLPVGTIDRLMFQVKVIDFGSSCFVDDCLTNYVQSRSYRLDDKTIHGKWWEIFTYYDNYHRKYRNQIFMYT